MTEIFVPTYKKESLRIMSMLTDKNLKLNLCVRSEEDDIGFYDKYKSNSQINIIRLGYNIHDIGETRQAILQYCFDNDIKYCPMFDDTVESIYNNTSNMTASQCIINAIEQMKTDKMSKYIPLFVFIKHGIIKPDGTRKSMAFNYNCIFKYFADFPAQAIILNLDVIRKYNLKYFDMNEYGLEDLVFVLNYLKEGLITLSDPLLRFDAEEVNTPKNGGNHTKASTYEKVRQKYNMLQYKTYEYYKDMMGVHFDARNHKYMQGNVAFVMVDWDFFRKVSVIDRDINQEIIDMKFSISKYAEKYCINVKK